MDYISTRLITGIAGENCFHHSFEIFRSGVSYFLDIWKNFLSGKLFPHLPNLLIATIQYHDFCEWDSREWTESFTFVLLSCWKINASVV